MERKSYTYYLFARPSFIEGVGRIFDFGNSLNKYNDSESENEADAKALYSDWVTVGNDMSTAMEDYGRRK